LLDIPRQRHLDEASQVTVVVMHVAACLFLGNRLPAGRDTLDVDVR